MSLRVGSLFSGIGGMDYGLERAGMTTVFQVEIDHYARNVLERHWPGLPRPDDVRRTRAANLPWADLVCLGYPCQDLSTANTSGKRHGLAGAKSGLWLEGLRFIREGNPTWVLVENVAKAWRNWVPVVRRDLWGLGYASLPILMRAQDLGAPHGRERVFIVAHTDSDGESVRAVHEKASRLQEDARTHGHWRTPPPSVLGVADGVSSGVGKQLRGYGNAVMPLMAEVLGRAILFAHQHATSPAPRR